MKNSEKRIGNDLYIPSFMCGIVGYIGKKQALPVLLQGLRDLEYRGYDSAGIAVLDAGKLDCIREVGKVDMLAKKIGSKDFPGNVGIGHTRWATHGGVTESNAHPQIVDGKLALVHNGIIENYRELKSRLKDQNFESETDTEILAKWISEHYQGDLTEAVREALLEVRGTYGILVMHVDNPRELVAARLGSPLCIGTSLNLYVEHFVASDITALIPHTRQVRFLNDGEIATIIQGDSEIKITNSKNEMVDRAVTEINWNVETAQKGGFEHFMLKEIFDQPTVFEDAIRGRFNVEEGTAHLGGLNMTEAEMREMHRIIIIGEGTARYAGLAAKYAFERLANIPTEVDFSSEFRYRDPIIDPHTLVFAISQSGETADTIMAIREARRKGAKVASIVNVVGSSIARETKSGTYIHAGPELAVASTKAYTNMVAVLLLYALQFGRLKHTTVSTGQRMLNQLLEIPTKMNQVLEQSNAIKKIATEFAQYENILFLGRGVNYPVALEGALKLKECSYIHCEGFAGGELKHGPLALVSKDVPIVALMTKNALYEKMVSNVQEARARGSKILAIATVGDETVKEVADNVIYVPKTMELLEPLLNTIPLQLLAYHISVSLGRDVDRPRNLAKSVTVE